ncbi:hypothetical protein D9M71_625040 [compost metagenome]
MHLVEFDLATQARQRATGHLGQFGPAVEDVPKPLHGNAGLLKVGPQLRQTHDRLRHPPCQHVEGHQLADGELAVDHQPRAEPQGRHGDQFADQ